MPTLPKIFRPITRNTLIIFFCLIAFCLYLCFMVWLFSNTSYSWCLMLVCDCGISWSYSKTCVKQPLEIRQNKDLNDKWASAWNFQQLCMCDQQSLRSARAYADQSLCLLLEYPMSIKLLTEHHLRFLSLKGGCTGWSVKCHIVGNHMSWLKW